MIYSRLKLKTIKSNYFVWKIKIASVYFVVPTDIERKIVHQFLVAIHFNKVTCIFQMFWIQWISLTPQMDQLSSGLVRKKERE